MPALDEDRNDGAAHSIPSRSRRQVLKAATATAALSALTFGMPLSAGAAAASAEGDFAAISQFLTGKSALDASVQSALLQAFLALDAGFGAKLAKLRTVVETAGTTPGNLHQILQDADKELAKLPQDILMGWYLGIAGSGKQARYVTYANDLANAAVADVLSPPSYAYGPCNSWAKQPI